jgi:mono/diheme cytochrome c family protein
MKRRVRLYFSIVLFTLSMFVISQWFRTSASASPPASSDRGSAIFRNSCSVCHSIRPGETKVGPSLHGVLREGSGRSEETVRQVITNGKGTMPAFHEKLESHAIDDLLEYLRTL